jgi:hypothetical protein
MVPSGARTRDVLYRLRIVPSFAPDVPPDDRARPLDDRTVHIVVAVQDHHEDLGELAGAAGEEGDRPHVPVQGRQRGARFIDGLGLGPLDDHVRVSMNRAAPRAVPDADVWTPDKSGSADPGPATQRRGPSIGHPRRS